MDRDFKGVWISKEIWLCENLSALDKVILAEIDSLDNENHCIAGNDYLAEFCMCSERKVSDTIRKLVDLGYIEVLSFDGRHRKIRVVKNSMEGRKNCEADLKKLQSNNIVNNQSNKKDIISKDIISEEKKPSLSIENDFLASKPKKEKKSNLYNKCYDLILDFTNNCLLQAKLKEYLDLRLQMKDKPLKYSNQWKGILNRLSELASNEKDMFDIINQSITKGWAAFYELKTYNTPNKDVFSEYGEVKSNKVREDNSSGQVF